MDRWLAQIGLKGRALESAVKSCEDNFVDDMSVLKDLVENRDAFPQAVIRTAITKALEREDHTTINETQDNQIQVVKTRCGAQQHVGMCN